MVDTRDYIVPSQLLSDDFAFFLTSTRLPFHQIPQAIIVSSSDTVLSSCRGARGSRTVLQASKVHVRGVPLNSRPSSGCFTVTLFPPIAMCKCIAAAGAAATVIELPPAYPL